MAYSRRRSSGRSVRRGYRSRAGSSRRVQRRAGSRRRSGGSGGARQQTVRIVLEHPQSNPMLTVPVGQTVDTSVPRKARF